MPARASELGVASQTGREYHPAMPRQFAPLAVLLLALQVPQLARAEAPPATADDLVQRIESVLRGDTAVMKVSMQIETPRWKRTVSFRSWDDRHGSRSFIRILEPRKDRGTGFLKKEQTLWTYLPRVERTTRLPPSMMLQSWMGSDFTNDDLVRESSLIDDYTARVLEEKEIDGTLAVGVELLPREDAPVVWSRIEIWVDAERLSPMLQLYYDEPEPGEFELLRRMQFSDVREVQGRPLPHKWVMHTLDKPGNETRFTIDEIEFDAKLDDSLFSLAHLKRAEAVR